MIFLFSKHAMLFFTKAPQKHRVVFQKLSSYMEHLSIAAEWAEKEWGYIRNLGVEFRKNRFSELRENIYIGTFQGKPVAMFALLPKKMHADLQSKVKYSTTILELMYVYVEKEYRDLGFGNQINIEAKKLARQIGADTILLDTLKPRLNRFYERHNARILCEHQLYSHPTEVMRMKI